MKGFKINDLEKMSPELATRILLLTTNEKIKEGKGNLDDLTTNLFRLPIPKFEIQSFIQNMHPRKSINSEIRVSYPENNRNYKSIDIHTRSRNAINGETNEQTFIYEIFYQCRNIIDGRVESISYLEPYVVSGHSLSTENSGHIALNLLYSFLPIEKVHINFLEALFIDELPKRYNSICSGDMMGFMFRGGNQCINLLNNYGERLLPLKQYLGNEQRD